MLTLFLAKVLGIYLVIAGLLMAAKHKDIVKAEKKFGKEILLRVSLGMLVSAAGLFLTVGYYDFSSLPAGIITVLGWATLLKGLVLNFMSDDSLEDLMKTINAMHWYVGGGIVAIIIGLYLAAYGFGFVW